MLSLLLLVDDLVPVAAFHPHCCCLMHHYFSVCLCVCMYRKEAEDMFQKFDRDGSGTVNVDEFLIGIRVKASRYFPHILN